MYLVFFFMKALVKAKGSSPETALMTSIRKMTTTLAATTSILMAEITSALNESSPETGLFLPSFLPFLGLPKENSVCWEVSHERFLSTRGGK